MSFWSAIAVLHYDDADNPLLDQPLSYVTYLNLRADQLPCSADDVIYGAQYATAVTYHCGGSSATKNGLTPMSLYGLPGIGLDLSVHQLDVRFQVTNSSPVNPQNLLSGSQHARWTAGAGYTVVQGFRVGFSAFRGPFLSGRVAAGAPAVNGSGFGSTTPTSARPRPLHLRMRR